VLPQAYGRDRDPLPESTTRRPATPAAHHGRSVLCIEDNATSMSLIEALMAADERFELLGADDGASGLKLARRRHPELILLDLGPDAAPPAAQVLVELEANATTAQIPVVILTADEQLENTDDPPTHTYISKPIELGEFYRTIDQLLDKQTTQTTVTTHNQSQP
jgi:DNA-binding response OmpR family regulator